MKNNRSRLIQDLLKRDGDKCYICGEPLNENTITVDHFIPLSQGGSQETSNLVLACNRCNARKGNYFLREYDFTSYLVGLMALNDNFKDVKTHSNRREEFGADISANWLVNNDWKELVIECKAFYTLTSLRASEVLTQLQNYKSKFNEADIVLAFPGKLNSDDADLFKASDIAVWDIDFIAKKFKHEIENVRHPLLQNLFITAGRKLRTREDELISELTSCLPGKTKWSVYQKLISTIFEHLFCPPLEKPISELPDYSGVNRRDFILPNYVENGFWAFLRSRYYADYIVVDPKNYSAEIKKKEVLQIANYLKQHGAGLFAIIVCRKGWDPGAIQTVRENWSLHNKLILILTDKDIIQMLTLSRSESEPVEVLKQKIEDFRLSL